MSTSRRSRATFRLKQLLYANLAGLGATIVVLGAINVTYLHAAPLWADLALMTVSAGALATAIWAHSKVRPQLTVWLVAAGLWVLVIGGTYVTPQLAPLMLLATMNPLVLMFRFLDSRRLWVAIIATMVVASLVPAVAMWRHDSPGTAGQFWVASISVIGAVPIVVLVVSVGLRQVYADLAQQALELDRSRQRLAIAAVAARRELERDLHDGAQQRMVTLSVHLSIIRNQLDTATPDQIRESLGMLAGEMNEAVAELRSLAQGIYPPLLAERGLAAALGAAARRSPIPCTLEADEIPRLGQNVESAIYFCVLEALQNAAKHSGSDAIRLELRADPVEFVVSDTGRGFDPRLAQESDGLLGIEARARAAGGSLRIETAPGHGTTVRGRFRGAGRPSSGT